MFSGSLFNIYTMSYLLSAQRLTFRLLLYLSCERYLPVAISIMNVRLKIFLTSKIEYKNNAINNKAFSSSKKQYQT